MKKRGTAEAVVSEKSAISVLVVAAMLTDDGIDEKEAVRIMRAAYETLRINRARHAARGRVSAGRRGK